MITKKYLLVATLLLMISGIYAQRISEFPTENEAFIKTMTDFMGASKKEGKKFVEKEFAEAFLEGSFSIDQQSLIIETCNQLLTKKHTAYPVFDDYLHALLNYPTSGKSSIDFQDWHLIIYSLNEDKKKKKYLKSFIKSSINLFGERAFYSSNSVKWTFSNNDYKFTYDSLPKITFAAGDVICYAKKDSSRILSTKGVFYPTLEKWYGEGGRVTWDRADFDPKFTYAEFDDYEIRIKGSSYVIDSVQFYNEYFDNPLLGQLTEKVLSGRSGEEASYPRFESYNQRLHIKNLFKNVDYDGGFTMRGNKLAGTGTNDEPAQLVFYREEKPFLTANSQEFSIRPERISSAHSAIFIRLENDSILHPDLNLKFDKNNRKLVLLRSEEGVSKSPYYNSYHEIDMYFEAMYWNIDDPLVEFGSIMGSSQHFAAFESKDYYKKLRYDAMMGITLETHPLVEIRNFTRYAGSEEFYSNELAAFMRLSDEQTGLMLIDLANQGFVEFDLNSRYCNVNKKLFDYLDANAGKKDYDVLQFNSDVGKGNNAQLNLLNYNLLVKGVQRIQVSDSQNVTIYPANEEVVLKKDRDFKFGGRMRAGNFEFIGKEYFFDYEQFLIDLIQVDSCRIYVVTDESKTDAFGNQEKTRVKNVLEEISGTLKLDAPTNKSGVHSENYPQYPILTSDKNSYVYYDNSKIQKGVYKRDKFYYQVEPFTIDSLDNFSKDDLAFNGTLVSGGIFPDIEEPLVLMEDYSLGFDLATANNGLPLYAGKGNFTADVKLNYNGLQGAGKLDYLTTTASSDQFVFFPDSTRGMTTSYENRMQKGSVEVPKTAAAVVNLGFFPKDDYLTATTVDEPIVYFENEAVFEGTSRLSPQGMRGSGDMIFEEATLSSLDFEYTTRKILADTSAFELKQRSVDNLAFKTDNVSAEIDFDKRFGEFHSNSGETKIELPANQYFCFMDQFKWFMDKDQMEMSSGRKPSDDFVIDTDEDASSSNFFSVHENQDSLNFLAPKAVYDIENTILTCEKIPFISVADSKILPDSGKVVIKKRAKMDPLEDATVIANYVTQYHRIFNADLNIRGRLEYDGGGDYAYVDENKNEQIIRIYDLKVDSTKQTVGFGTIEEEDDFSLSPFFSFKGDFELYANVENLTFDGGTQITHGCEELERNWFKFRTEINPNELYIPVDTNLRDVGMSKLGVGVMVSDDAPIELYSSFLSRKKDRNDNGLIEALGYLYFNKNKRQYQIGSKEKLKQPKLPGNLVNLSVDDCLITGDGKIDYQVDYGHVKLTSVGDVTQNTINGEADIKGVLALDFFMDDAVLKRLTEQLQKWPGLDPVDITKTSYEKSIQEIMGLEASDKAITELNLSGQFKKVPQEIQKTMYFCDVKFKWDDVEESFVSDGPIGIATIDKKQIFRYVKGKIELGKNRSSDVLRVYLELDPGNWYYFEYKLGIMNIVTTDKELTTTITELKEDKRKTKDDEGNKFTFQLIASKKKRNDFVDRFREFD